MLGSNHIPDAAICPSRLPQTSREYLLDKKLGEGGFAKVFCARESHSGELVAIKYLDGKQASRSQIDSLVVEINLLRKLKHPNIVEYKGFMRSPHSFSFILEYCPNGSLSDMIKIKGKLSERLAAKYVHDTLKGLNFLHSNNLIHRDIKAANLLVAADGTVKLADFGVATIMKLKGNYTCMGTPHWMAPEILGNDGASPASDIWSLGCTVVELLVGVPPHYKKAPSAVIDSFNPIPESISEDAKGFLRLCFIKNPLLRATARRLLNHRWIRGDDDTEDRFTYNLDGERESLEGSWVIDFDSRLNQTIDFILEQRLQEKSQKNTVIPKPKYNTIYHKRNGLSFV